MSLRSKLWHTYQTVRSAILRVCRQTYKMRRFGLFTGFGRLVFRFKSRVRYAHAKNKGKLLREAQAELFRQDISRDKRST